MILLDVTYTSFGQDIMAVTNQLVIVICVGVALKICLLYTSDAADE